MMDRHVKIAQTLCSALIVFGLYQPLCKADPRNITEVRYRFTPCGATGSRGPSHNKCIDYYDSIGERNGQLFDIRGYQGAQGFQVPREGLYNITVVGASGGRGICNPQSGGLGVKIQVQVQLTRDVELMIVVGQQGTGPCDVIPEDDPVYAEFCTNLPDSSIRASMCNTSWSTVTGSYDALFRDIFGGGGGGGASMVRARKRETFDGLPIVISGGGGGSPSQLYYDIVEVINVDSALLSSEKDYVRFLSGKTANNSLTGNSVAGTRGTRAQNNRTDSFIAGAGGGYNPATNSSSTARMDGKSFSTDSMNFAEGGLDCAQIQRESQTDGFPFFGTVGGFGGGGGGCAEGGGGGGYTGGSVLRGGMTVPGGGGFSYVGNGNVTNIEPTVLTILGGNSSGDGYVEIIETHCGCVYQCSINEGEGTYECTCPDGAFLIGADWDDCYYVSPIDVTEHVFMDYYTILEFPSSVYLYGFQATLNLRAEDGSECVLLFTGKNSQIVLVSNVVSSLIGSVHTLAFVNFSPNTNLPMISNYTSFLSEGVLVTGAIVVSSDECNVDTGIFAGISIRESSEDVLTPNSPISIEDIQSLENLLLSPLDQTDSETTVREGSRSQPAETSTMEVDPHISDAALSLAQLIGIIVGVIVVLVVGVFMVIFLVTYVRMHHKWSAHGDTSQLQEAPDNCRIDSCSPLPLTTMNDYVATGERRSLSLLVASKHVEELPSDMMISSENLRLGKMVGEGEFGSVYKAQLRITSSVPLVPVAVKTLKGFFSEKLVDEMLKESKKMCHLNHPNVQTLIGVCVDGGPTPYIVMPFMENGSLLSFLRKNKDTLFLKQGSEEYEIIAIAKRLTEMCFQITKGMEYLAANNIIHRDLAARNCMINEKHVICVSDFGLSENTYSKTYFRQENHKNVLLPMKWVAPESYNFGIFSEKTDVWSFGVTCWEVFSAGKIPYPGITAQSLPQLIDSGHRMDKPDNAACTDAMYNVMTQCWYSEADERPTFSELVQTIESDLVSRGDYLALGGDTSDGPTIEDQAPEDAEIRIDIMF